MKLFILNALICGYIVNAFTSRSVYRTWEARETIRKNNFLWHVRERML